MDTLGAPISQGKTALASKSLFTSAPSSVNTKSPSPKTVSPKTVEGHHRFSSNELSPATSPQPPRAFPPRALPSSCPDSPAASALAPSMVTLPPPSIPPSPPPTMLTSAADPKQRRRIMELKHAHTSLHLSPDSRQIRQRAFSDPHGGPSAAPVRGGARPQKGFSPGTPFDENLSSNLRAAATAATTASIAAEDIAGVGGIRIDLRPYLDRSPCAPHA